MKINVASPNSGTQKQYEVTDEKVLQLIYDKRVSQEFDGEILGEDFKGYTLKITGGQDKQGFPMKQGVLANSRVRLLLKRGDTGFASWRARKGERKRKSIRGCIVGPDLAVVNTIITKEGDAKVEGLTDTTVPRRVGPKRASKIRKLFNLTKQDDVRKYVIRKVLPAKEGKKERSKAPKIQRLVTPITLERKRRKRALLKKRREKSHAERAAYQHLLDRRRSLSALKKKHRASRHLLGLKLKELNQIAARKQKIQRQKALEEKKKAEKEAKAKPKAKAKAKPEPKAAEPKAKADPKPKAEPKAAKPEAKAKKSAK
jgi:small subunit ribosomal protein S6e